MARMGQSLLGFFQKSAHAAYPQNRPFRIFEVNIHAFIDNLCADHGAAGYELASDRFFVRILSNGIEHNICIKKCSGGHNIHHD